jgi:hypothetical protein
MTGGKVTKDELAAKVWEMVQSLDFPPNIIGLASTKHWTQSKIYGFTKKTLERALTELQEAAAQSGAATQHFETSKPTPPSNRELELTIENAKLQQLLNEAEQRIAELSSHRDTLEENRILRMKNEELTENYSKVLEAYTALKRRKD